MDDEFFKDKDERRSYFVCEKVGFTAESIQEESLTARGSIDCDSAMLQALAGPDGLMQPGGFPDVPGLSTSSMASHAVENFEGVQTHKKLKGKKPQKV